MNRRKEDRLAVEWSVYLEYPPARAAVDEHVVEETNDREKHIFNGIRVYR